MKMRQKELEIAKQTLENAVTKADKELQELRKTNVPKRLLMNGKKSGSGGSGLWPF